MLSGQLVQEVAEGPNPYRTVYRNNRPRHKEERECMTTTTLDLLRQEVFVGRPAVCLVCPWCCQTNRTKHQKQRENDYVCPHLENPDRQINFSSQNHKRYRRNPRTLRNPELTYNFSLLTYNWSNSV